MIFTILLKSEWQPSKETSETQAFSSIFPAFENRAINKTFLRTTDFNCLYWFNINDDQLPTISSIKNNLKYYRLDAAALLYDFICSRRERT